MTLTKMPCLSFLRMEQKLFRCLVGPSLAEPPNVMAGQACGKLLCENVDGSGEQVVPLPSGLISAGELRTLLTEANSQWRQRG
jgi:hypothetical protein